MENESKIQAENTDSSNEKLLLSDVIKSLPYYDDYIITTEDSEEHHFVNADTIESAINIYKNWSNGESVMAKNTRIYKVVDITDAVKGNVL
jgi:hypothetical protein